MTDEKGHLELVFPVNGLILGCDVTDVGGNFYFLADWAGWGGGIKAQVVLTALQCGRALETQVPPGTSRADLKKLSEQLLHEQVAIGTTARAV